MKTITLTAAAFTLMAAAPLVAADLAAGVDLASGVNLSVEVDADGNGTFSLEELQTAYPELTAETFAEIDANADGEADPDEVKAAQDAGVLAAAG